MSSELERECPEGALRSGDTATDRLLQPWASRRSHGLVRGGVPKTGLPASATQAISGTCVEDGENGLERQGKQRRELAVAMIPEQYDLVVDGLCNRRPQVPYGRHLCLDRIHRARPSGPIACCRGRPQQPWKPVCQSVRAARLYWALPIVDVMDSIAFHTHLGYNNLILSPLLRVYVNSSIAVESGRGEQTYGSDWPRI